MADGTDAPASGSEYVPLDRRTGPLPSTIRNREKRAKLYEAQKTQKAKDKRESRTKRKRELQDLGDQAPKRPEQKTLDSKRVADETIVLPDDEEVAVDEGTDELAAYFNGAMPKIIVTTSVNAIGDTFKFAESLINIFPTAEYHARKQFGLKQIIAEAIEKGFTDLVVVNEDRREPNGLVITHLPDGPTAHFKLGSITYEKEIKNHGKSLGYYPEVILNNFHTRLGHQVGRLISALFPQAPEFKGREVVTWHNQRDFIFFRHHRYIFRNTEKVGLQELGPRFTLKLRSLQKGTFDSKFGEYEWVHKRKEMDTARTKFFL